MPQPGRTQLINFYRVGGQFRFVDLPGYGYARVPKEIASQWKRLIEQYLFERRSLELCFLILDARRGWMEKDMELKQWLEFHNRRYMVIATKTDKLKGQKEQRHQTAAIRSQILDSEPLPFSAVTCRGVREIWQAISKIKTQQAVARSHRRENPTQNRKRKAASEARRQSALRRPNRCRAKSPDSRTTQSPAEQAEDRR